LFFFFIPKVYLLRPFKQQGVALLLKKTTKSSKLQLLRLFPGEVRIVAAEVTEVGRLFVNWTL